MQTTFQHPQLADDDYTGDILTGAAIYGPGDEKVGSVSAVHGDGRGGHAVVDVGGFLGIGAKPVAIPLRDIHFVRDEFGAVSAMTDWTKDQVKQFPEHKPHW